MFKSSEGQSERQGWYQDVNYGQGYGEESYKKKTMVMIRVTVKISSKFEGNTKMAQGQIAQPQT